MTRRIVLIDNPAFTRMFPARRVATVAIACRDGSIVTSEPTEAHGDPERPLSDHEVSDKFHRLASHLASSRRRRIEDAVDSIDRQPDALEKLMSAVLTRVREPARPKRADRTETHAKPSNKPSNLERIT